VYKKRAAMVAIYRQGQKPEPLPRRLLLYQIPALFITLENWGAPVQAARNATAARNAGFFV